MKVHFVKRPFHELLVLYNAETSAATLGEGDGMLVKVCDRAIAPEGATDSVIVAASLERCPDTNRAVIHAVRRLSTFRCLQRKAWLFRTASWSKFFCSLPGSPPARGLFMVLLLGVATAFAGEDSNPLARDPNAAKLGEFQFRINCAFCHGLGARGGGRGPDLTRAHKKYAHSDAEMFQIINNGIPGTAMPANGTNGQGVGMSETEIRQLISYIRSVEVKSAAQPTGNAAHGKQLFYGDANCSGCHMVDGKGGRLGPELTGVGGARTVESIVDSVRNPSRRLAWGLTEATKEFPQEYETVTVVTADGQEIKGVALNEDDFSVQIMDMSENIHLVEKDKLRAFAKSRVSLMPAYGVGVLSDTDLQDIVAYLVGVGAK
jgi:cytochrome c oxidase cbb3-type subunit III